MNIIDVTKSILTPDNKMLSVEGSLGSDSPLRGLLSHNLFSKVLALSVAATILLSTCAQTANAMDVESSIQGPPLVTITHNINTGNKFSLNDSDSFFLEETHSDTEINGNININSSASQNAFIFIKK